MTQQEKSILLRDLCARLPYGVKIKFSSPLNGQDVVEKLRDVAFRGENILLSTTTWNNIELNECKPYLRPMSSMTEEERIEMREFCDSKPKLIYDIGVAGQIHSPNVIDFLNSHHFDYRGLIEKNLAIDCTNLNIY